MKVGVLGAGELGQALAKEVAARPGLTLDSVVDIRPELIGTEIPGTDRTVERAFGEQLEVIFQVTTSSMEDAATQLSPLLSSSAAIISSCEEMAFPIEQNAEVARDLDAAARVQGCRVTAAGVNPGFAMDILPVALTAVQTSVRSIRVHRVVDLRARRPNLGRKMGVGRPTSEVASAIRSGAVGHVGLRESVHLLAAAINAAISAEEHSRRAIDRDGTCAGIAEDIRCALDGIPVRLTLEMSMHAESVDLVEIDGTPALSLRIDPGISGDTATIGRMINLVPVIRQAAPGFHTALDLRVPRYSIMRGEQ